MKVNPIYFGKAIKVFAPFHIARKIANSANGNPYISSDIQEILKNVFNDTKDGHALAFYPNENEDSGYILSGKESREYQRSLYKKALEVKKTKSQDPLPIALKKVLQSRYDHNQRAAKIIQNAKEDFALEISDNGNKINIIGNK